MKVDYKNKKVLSSEEAEKVRLEYAVKETSLELQSNILATEKSLEEAKKELAEAKQEYPVNFNAIVEASLKVRDYEDGLRLLNSLKEEWGI